mmetsp:Transcript_96473/g.268085  ORF Transcript_96473/g.268085 Transcript_96473/m.268085 type:complete len:201 (-) Transcript_96473:2266-2868(-)
MLVGRGLRRSTQEAPLVQPVSNKAIGSADVVHDGHTSRVQHDAEKHVQRLRQPQCNVPIGEHVNRVNRFLRDLLPSIVPHLHWIHKERVDKWRHRGGENLQGDGKDNSRAHGDKPPQRDVVVAALTNGERPEKEEPLRCAFEVRVHKEGQQPRVHKLCKEQLPELAPDGVRLGTRALPADQVIVYQKQENVERRDSKDGP